MDNKTENENLNRKMHGFSFLWLHKTEIKLDHREITVNMPYGYMKISMISLL